MCDLWLETVVDKVWMCGLWPTAVLTMEMTGVYWQHMYKGDYKVFAGALNQNNNKR
jgi:hypothetical protein